MMKGLNRDRSIGYQFHRIISHSRLCSTQSCTESYWSLPADTESQRSDYESHLQCLCSTSNTLRIEHCTQNIVNDVESIPLESYCCNVLVRCPDEMWRNETCWATLSPSEDQWFANVSSNDERWYVMFIHEILYWSKLLIPGYTFNNQAIKAVELFQELERRRFFFKNHLQSGSNWITYLCLINALSKLGDFSIAEYLLKNMPNSFREMRFIANSLLDMWVRTISFLTVDDGFLHYLNDSSARAKLVTLTDPKKSSGNFRNPITLVMQQWVSGNKLCVVRNLLFILVIVNALGLNGMGAEASELYDHTPEHLRNHYTHLCVINACSHSGLVTKARVLFKQIPEKTDKIVTAMVWNAIDSLIVPRERYQRFVNGRRSIVWVEVLTSMKRND